MSEKKDVAVPVRVGKSKKAARVLRVLAPVLLVLIFCAAFLRLALPRFLVKGIEVRGASIYTSEELLSLSQIEIGEEVLAVDLDRAVSSILSACPYIRSVTATVRLTGRVVLNITEEKNLMFTERNGVYYSISERLKVLETSLDESAFSSFLYAELPDDAILHEGNVVQFGKGEEWAKDAIADLVGHVRAGKYGASLSGVSVKSEHNLSYVLNGTCRVLVGDASNMEEMDRLLESYLRSKGGIPSSPTTVDLRDPQKIIESPGI